MRQASGSNAPSFFDNFSFRPSFFYFIRLPHVFNFLDALAGEVVGNLVNVS